MKKEKQNNIWSIFSGISGLIAIFEFVYRVLQSSVKSADFILSGLFFASLILAVLFYLISKTSKEKIRLFLYNIKKNLIYWFGHSGELIEVIDKQRIYTQCNKNKYQFQEIHTIKSNTPQLNSFSDKFKWSRPLSVEETKELFKSIITYDPSNKITLSRYENWINYTVTFPGIGKGDTTTVDFIAPNLTDPDETSLPFLSGHVVYKTTKMTLRVVFEGAVEPRNIEYKIFNNYASPYPIIKLNPQKCEKLSVKKGLDNNDKRTSYIEYTEEKPIPGYRYVLTWRL